MKFLAYWKRVYRDFFDKSAEKNKSPLTFKDIWGLLFVALPAIANLIGYIKDILISTFGLYASLIPILILIVALFWCIYVIRSTQNLSQQSAIVFERYSSQKLIYMFPQPLRVTFKISFCLFLILLPFSIKFLIDDIVPLPTTLYGNIFDIANGDPVEDARVRILTKDNVDVTSGEWRTDSKGFYIVQTKIRVQKDGQLLVIVPPCNKEFKLPLLPSFQSYSDMPNIKTYIYRHSINAKCQ